MVSVTDRKIEPKDKTINVMSTEETKLTQLSEEVIKMQAVPTELYSD